jgi:hypothetical protein
MLSSLISVFGCCGCMFMDCYYLGVDEDPYSVALLGDMVLLASYVVFRVSWSPHCMRDML